MNIYKFVKRKKTNIKYYNKKKKKIIKRIVCEMMGENLDKINGKFIPIFFVHDAGKDSNGFVTIEIVLLFLTIEKYIKDYKNIIFNYKSMNFKLL
jgi:hypothetical protein